MIRHINNEVEHTLQGYGLFMVKLSVRKNHTAHTQQKFKDAMIGVINKETEHLTFSAMRWTVNFKLSVKYLWTI